MLSNEKKKEIILKMNEKNIKQKYQKNILKYIELNAELFDCINIDELIKRILKNFSGVSLNLTSLFYHDYGQYIPTTGKILLSPNLFFGKNRKYKESVFLHELDHCACSPIMVKNKYYQYKNEIKQKYKYMHKIIPDFILSELFLKIHYEGQISGIANFERNKGYTIQKLTYGAKIENYLNEGITSLKQIIYSERLDIKFHKNRDFFYGARIGVQCISDAIGFKNLIFLHFNNDLQSIRDCFYTKTGIKIDDLMTKCAVYDQKKTKKKLKELNDYIVKIYQKCHKN